MRNDTGFDIVGQRGAYVEAPPIREMIRVLNILGQQGYLNYSTVEAPQRKKR